jgi:N-dimethylarginine dimethylaminohydrolase
MSAHRSFGDQSMFAPLRKVLICSPRQAGWSDPALASRWRELGYLHEPEPGAAAEQHDLLVAHLREWGAEVIQLTDAGGLSLDTAYTRDPSLVTEHGAICLRMGKSQRSGEPERHRAWYEAAGIPVLGEIREPGTVECGDLLWLDRKTLLAGRTYRTNAAGIDQLRALLGPKGLEVISAPVPHGEGPGVCLHFMSLVSILDERVALVDLPLMAVETVDLLRRMEFTFIEIDPAERVTMAANVLSLGNRRLLAIHENARTNDRMREHGFDVRTFPGTEICQNGGGGPTCLTQPVLRE